MGLKLNTIELDGLTTDPTSPPDGCIWFRSDLGKFKKRRNGQNEEVSDAPIDFVEKYHPSTRSPALANTWETHTLQGASPNTTCQVLIEKAGTHTSGVREVGSGLDRIASFTESVILTVKTNGSSQIQIKSSDILTTFRLIGELS